MDIVAVNLRRLRQESGLLQKELAGRAEMNPSNLSKLERGEYTWTKGTLNKLALVLGVPVSAFFEEADRSPGAPPELPAAGTDVLLRRILLLLEKWDRTDARRS